MIWKIVFTLLCTIVSTGFCSQIESSPTPSCLKKNVSFNVGYSLAVKIQPGVKDCQLWCQDVYQCSHFSFDPSSFTCYLGQDNTEMPASGFLSGPNYCPRILPSGNASLPVCNDNVCIVGGRFPYEGNVLVNKKPVCDDNWGLEDAAVVCRQLGYPGVEAATVESKFGSEGSDYFMEHVKCRGNETKLLDCEHKQQNTCFSHEAAGVVCSRNSLGLDERCYQGSEVCLVGGTSLASGNVYVGGHPVCHNGWDFADANVACRSLGYIGAADFTIKSFFGISVTYFLVGDVDCRGDEQSLDECPKSFSVGSCTGHNIAGTHCIPMKATHLMSGQDNVIIGLTVTLSVVIFILFLMTVYIFKNKIKGLRTKVESLELPSKSSIIRYKTQTSVEDLVGADFNQICNNASNNFEIDKSSNAAAESVSV